MKLLRQGEVARLLGVDRATLRRWRGRDGGPAFIRLGVKLIRYRETDLEAWLRRSTLATKTGGERATTPQKAVA